jgi:hypothetical protein
MPRGETKPITLLIKAAIRILTKEWPMTIRQLFYRIVSTKGKSGQALMVNSTASYKKVSRIMTKARRDGRCDYDFIVDRSRADYTAGGWNNPTQFLRYVSKDYHRDYWTMQPKYVEIWTEKDAVIGSIESLCQELGVSIYPCKGFNSTTKVHECAERLQCIDKPIEIFYAGDWDSSGTGKNGIEEDAKRRVLEQGAPPFTMTRLAIFPEDIKKYDLPFFKAKESDSRTPGFRVQYSNKCIELDALPPNELRRRIRNAVEAVMDMESWARAVAVEEVEKKSILDFIARFPKKAA